MKYPFASLILVACFSFIIINASEPAATGRSEHHHGVPHKGFHERESDGAYSPRKHPQYDPIEHDADFDHEAILGSSKLAQEYESLSVPEAKESLAILLSKMDANGNHQIERAELKLWISSSLRSLNNEEAADRFEDADTNEDDMISWNEYISDEFEDDESEKVSEEERLDRLQYIDEDKILFEAADKDGDNRLTREEFVSFSFPSNDESMRSVVFKRALAIKDDNKDGRIDFEEFIGDRGKDQDGTWFEDERERFNNELDTDNDGTLNQDEIEAWIIPDDEKTADDETDHLFSTSDIDKNDVLSFEEILDNHETFVGSEATKYGEQLENIKEEL